MNTQFMLAAIAATIACSASPVLAQDVVKPAPSVGAATTVYRQVMPDGRIVYSDKALKGAKIDHTITVDPAIKGNSWTTEAGPKPVVAPQVERTPINKVNPPPGMRKQRSASEATSDIIRAEMLLEDAKKRQEAGVEPLPGERTGNASGGSRLNEAYQARQQALERDVAEAEAVLKKANSDRDALRVAR
jgi:hypothetical protein